MRQNQSITRKQKYMGNMAEKSRIEELFKSGNGVSERLIKIAKGKKEDPLKKWTEIKKETENREIV